METAAARVTSIQVRVETWKRLRERVSEPGDTMDVVITRMLDQTEGVGSGQEAANREGKAG